MNLFPVAVEMMAQDREVDLIERYAKLRNELKNSQIEQGRLQQQADSLALLIRELKAKETTTFFEKRKLETLLKESQNLSQQQERISAKQGRLKTEQHQIGSTLIGHYSVQIDSLLHLLSSAGKSRESQQQLLSQIQVLRRKRSVMESQVIPKVAEVSAVNQVTIEADDTPEQIEAKRIYYLDQAEKLKARAALLQDQIHRVKKETKLRQRMSDLVDDVRLFDQSDEPYLFSQAESEPMRFYDDSNQERVNSPVAGGEDGESIPSSLDFERFLQINVHALSEYQVDHYIELLQNEEQRYLSVADSLTGIAGRYARQAESLRQTIDENRNK